MNSITIDVFILISNIFTFIFLVFSFRAAWIMTALICMHGCLWNNHHCRTNALFENKAKTTTTTKISTQKNNWNYATIPCHAMFVELSLVSLLIFDVYILMDTEILSVYDIHLATHKIQNVEYFSFIQEHHKIKWMLWNCPYNKF